MSFANRFIVKIRRSESPFFKFLKRLIKSLFSPTLPPLPNLLKPPLRLLYELHFLIITLTRSLITICYRNPLFQGRCASFGRNVYLEGLPYVCGHVEIHVGSNVRFGGKVSILSGGGFDLPKLIMKDRSGVGWGTMISVSKEVIIEEDAIVSYDCRISDTDGHRREADLRAAGVRPDVKESRPVRIGRYAFIANGAHIMKGVTIGEGATVGANSVVISNVPPYSLAIGNPAEILFRNYGLPSTARRKKSAASKPDPSASGVPAVDN
jgi:acetyltransferase-like isoleucine patch superfamily enzyme